MSQGRATRQGRLMTRLPIYLAAKDLATKTVRASQNFPKMVKYTFGEQLQHSAIMVMRCVGMAMYHTETADRIRAVEELQANFEELKGLLGISFEQNWLSLRQYADFAESVESIGRQSSAWWRNLQKKMGGAAKNGLAPAAGERALMRETSSYMEWEEALMRADNGDGHYRAPHTSSLSGRTIGLRRSTRVPTHGT